jgi:hypothetical protein
MKTLLKFLCTFIAVLLVTITAIIEFSIKSMAALLLSVIILVAFIFYPFTKHLVVGDWYDSILKFCTTLYMPLTKWVAAHYDIND